MIPQQATSSKFIAGAEAQVVTGHEAVIAGHSGLVAVSQAPTLARTLNT